MTIELHRGDLPAGLKLGPVVAVDTETMGLNPVRDRLCLVQLSQGDGICHLVQIAKPAHGQRAAACVAAGCDVDQAGVRAPLEEVAIEARRQLMSES